VGEVHSHHTEAGKLCGSPASTVAPYQLTASNGAPPEILVRFVKPSFDAAEKETMVESERMSSQQNFAIALDF
jgi:hypothetical protein